jgi:hypothetical protein
MEIKQIMKRARLLEEVDASIAPEKLVDEASTFVVGLFCFRAFLFTFLPLLLERNLAILLTERGKVDQAEKLMRDELEMLYLRNGRLSDDEAVIVAAFIKVNDTVEEVYLYGCNIGPRGAKAFADALKHNKKVWRLDLNYNRIRNQGADAIIDALNHNVCITELSVGRNEIAHESMATIEYLTETRNKVLIPDAVRRASFYLIAARRATPIADAGDLAVFPKEIVKMIAMEVWATRKDTKWIEAVPTQRSGKCSIQ